MTIESPSRRLRLFMLSLSLFCFAGIAAAQTNSPPATPPGISVVEHKWKIVSRSRRHDMVDASPPTFGGVQVDDNTGQVKPPNNNADLRRGVDDLVSTGLIAKSWLVFEPNSNYSYWLKIQNASPRKIRSLAFYYVFIDRSSNAELRRYAMQNFMEIAPNQTKWVWSPGNDSPPVRSIKGPGSPVTSQVEITCVLFTDGTHWKSPDTSQETCDELIDLTRKQPRGKSKPD